MLLHQPVGVHDAQRILGRGEGADLHEQRLVLWDRQHPQDIGHLAGRQLAVLLGERVDGGMDHVLRHAEAPAEARQREDGGVVLVDERPEERPRAPLRPRGVEVAGPHPAAARRTVLDERGRLHVVHEHEVGVERELLGVHAVHLDEVVERLVGEDALAAAQGRLQGGRRRIEARVAAGDLPRGVDTEVGHHRYQGLEDLGGAGAEPPAGEVQEAPAAHPLGKGEDDVHHARRRHAAVVLDANHRALPSSAASTSPSTRARTRSRLVM